MANEALNKPEQPHGKSLKFFAYQTLFDIYAKQGDKKKEQNLAQEILNSGYGHLMLYRHLGEHYAKGGKNLKLAAQCYEKALEVTKNPNNLLGTVYYGQLSNESMNKVMNSWLATLSIELGQVYLKSGRHDRAIAVLEQAKGLNKESDGKILYQLGLALEKAHQQDKALATLLTALVQYKNDEARKPLERIYSEKRGSLKGLAEMILASATEEKKGAALAPSTSRISDIDNAIVKARSLISGEAPDFSVTTLAGEEITASKLQGKVAVLDFWATWCGPCRQELPHYQKAYEKYRDNANVVFLAISTDDNDQVVQEFIAENQYAFAAARSPKTAQAYGVTAIPTLIIIGKDGKVQYRQVGFDSNSDFVKTLSQKIDLLLATNVK